MRRCLSLVIKQIPPRTATVRALGVAAVTLFLAAACSAGQGAETSHEVSAIPGADADAGPIALRDLLVPFRDGGYRAGSDVPLVVRMFSSAEQPDKVSQVEPGAAGRGARLTTGSTRQRTKSESARTLAPR